MIIDGQVTAAEENAVYPIYSPATGEVVGEAAQASLADLEKAVSSSLAAFKEWSRKTAYERERVIRQAASYCRAQAEEIGRLMALEQGKPWKQSTSEVVASCEMLDYYAAEGVRIEGTINQTEKPNYRSWVTHQPVGVCGAITPWNYPVALLSWKLGPALAAGCTVVVKPTPVTPLCASAFCKALCEGGLPPGVINVVTGSEPNLGEALVRHPDIAKIGMTGSTRVGKQILEACAPSLKRVSLELGGHCPAIVCVDADLELAAKVIAYKGFRNGGQSCSSVNRVYAQGSICEALLGHLKSIAESQTMGDGLTDPSVDLGPLCTKATLTNVEAHVTDAIEKGARVVTGAKRPAGDAFAKGHFYLPTVMSHCGPGMKLWEGETFGPVVPVTTFEDEVEAIAGANDTTYGLASYVFTKNAQRALEISDQLEAGTVCVNHGAVNTSYGPYEGWKESGFGLELSRKAIFEYLKTKHIKLAL